MEISTDGLTFHIRFDESSGWKVNAATETTQSWIEYLHIEFHAETPAVPPETEIAWSIPNVDIQARWSPTAAFAKNIPPDWNSLQTSTLACGAPVLTFFNSQGENRMTVAVTEAMRSVQLFAGVHEEDNRILCRAVLFSQPESPLTEYATTLRLDRRGIFYADSIREVSDWFAGMEEYRPAAVPEAARKAIYSTWYSYHQNLFDKELEAECALAAEAGLAGVIVDDGWQTDDNKRKYAFCGDWKVSKRRFPDMKAHVKRIHALGMKYLLWFGVSYMGYQCENHRRFDGKYLFHLDRSKASVLDPRFPEVRDYLLQTYETALKEWDIDGFKLDFIELFRFEGTDPAIAENYAGRDIKSLPLAVDKLLSDVIARLKAVKPDLLIEFRQNYIGPAVRKYGNIFRASDCPADILSNRVRTVDLRLFSGNTAVHSDMLEWNMEEPAEIAALQILNVIFSVPQISIRFAELPETHRRMLRFWLDFAEKHREVLLEGRFMPFHPELNYPVVAAENGREKVIAVYQTGAVAEIVCEPGQSCFVVNATGSAGLILDLKSKPLSAKYFDAAGTPVPGPAPEVGLCRVPVPASGLLELRF